jgi:hypothetical protein
MRTIIFMFACFSILFISNIAWSAQVICIDPEFFEPAESKFIIDQKKREEAIKDVQKRFVGNIWTVVEDKKALGGTAFGAPGDNDFNSNEHLVIKLPMDVKAGEAGPWKLWARLNKSEDPNSFYWRISQDKKTWVPPDFVIDAAGWNNPANPLLINGKEPWFWFDGVGAPNLKSGVNYLSLSCRESGLQIDAALNLIDVLCARNDGKNPTDDEAIPMLAEQYKDKVSPLKAGGQVAAQAVKPGGKLTTSWGQIKEGLILP